MTLSEHLVPRRKPRDGGRGREYLTKNTSLRFFDAGHGLLSRRGSRWFGMLRWSVPGRDVLFGVVGFRDEDGDLNLYVGVWPFRWEFTLTRWERP